MSNLFLAICVKVRFSPAMPPHLTLLLNMLAGWMNRHQQMAIDYLMEVPRSVATT